MLNTPALSPRDTERRAQELLYEWAKGFFNGQPHPSKLGEVTFPRVDFFFNQTEIDSPTARPQIHFVFANFIPHETWWTDSDVSSWNYTLNAPFSGVAYGLTNDSVEESVHGKLARAFPDARDIRWRAVAGDGLHEEVQLRADMTWLETRFIAGATAIEWKRVGSAYVEQANIAGILTPIRTISPKDPLWDGSKKLVTVDATILAYIRTVTRGDHGERGDFLCRSVADNLKEILNDEDARGPLTQKGFRRVRITGSTVLASSGFQTRLVTLDASLRYFLPRSM